ncbi:MAG: exodeoxyribonuclease VII small subunit [Eubacterium sp.]|nr:exodeoxyribonuclease VII small subunit [Eubacterium sp.]
MEDMETKETETTDNEDERFDVESALKRLEEINTRLAAGNMPLSDSIVLYKEGVELAAKAKEHLEGVEKELQIVREEN